MKFVIESVVEKSSIQKHTKGFDFSKEYEETVWDYEIMDKDGNKYTLFRQHKPILGLLRGKTIRTFVEPWGKDGERITGTLSCPLLQSPQRFKKNILFAINRAGKRIDWDKKEIKRLESLVA